MNYRHIALFLCLLLIAAIPVIAGQKNMLLCLPGFPGTSAQAQPYVDKMLRHLEVEMGFEAGSMSGAYLPDGDGSISRLDADKPGFALMGPSILAKTSKSMKPKVIALVEANGRGEETFHVITRKGGPSDLQALSGKTIGGTVIHDARYVYNVLLDKKLPHGSVTLKASKRPLKALREVEKGTLDAAIVDQSVADHIKDLDFADSLQIIYSSKPVPAPAVVVFGNDKVYETKLKNALVGMCDKESGKDLCKSLTITSIKAATNAHYSAFLKRYNRP